MALISAFGGKKGELVAESFTATGRNASNGILCNNATIGGYYVITIDYSSNAQATLNGCDIIISGNYNVGGTYHNTYLVKATSNTIKVTNLTNLAELRIWGTAEIQ